MLWLSSGLGWLGHSKSVSYDCSVLIWFLIASSTHSRTRQMLVISSSIVSCSQLVRQCILLRTDR